ncbi:hypothetical protein P692DRAFT_20831375 [Suillus brevipes Sb2]|nr:hypothetical protein P692DRAFT_20831375 [Suillus brevipes Sb2]
MYPPVSDKIPNTNHSAKRLGVALVGEEKDLIAWEGVSTLAYLVSHNQYIYCRWY